MKEIAKPVFVLRFFDLDGPLVFGKSPVERTGDRDSFEGCIGDIRINEKLANLRADSGDMLAENNTVAGCPPKSDECRVRADALRAQCSKCSHTWSRSMRCECRLGDDYEFSTSDATPQCRYVMRNKPDAQVLTLADNGYLALNERQVGGESVLVQFDVKARPSTGAANSTLTLLQMRFINMIDEFTMRLVYDWLTDEMRLIRGDQTDVALVLRKNRILDDEFWSKIEIEFRKDGLLRLTVNEVFEKKVVAEQIQALFGQKYTLKWSIHGPICVRGIRVNNDPSFGYRAVNAIKGNIRNPT